MSGRRQTYRIEVGPDLYAALTKEAKMARPHATLRAVAEMLLWDSLTEVAAHRVRAAGQATEVPGPQTVGEVTP